MIGLRVHSSLAGVRARQRLPWRDPHGNHVKQPASGERSTRRSAIAEFPIGHLVRVLEELVAARIDGFVQSTGVGVCGLFAEECAATWFSKRAAAAVGELVFKAVIMNNDWQIIECRGYKAYVEIDFDSGEIIGRVYNIALSDHCIEFSADNISDLHAAFENALDAYHHRCHGKGVEPYQPTPDTLPPIVFKNYSRWFPELERRASDLVLALGGMDRKLALLVQRGLLDIIQAEQLNDIKPEDMFDAIKIIVSLTDYIIPENSRLWWLVNRLIDDVEMVVKGNEPIFLKVDPFKGTKNSSPKHAALRIECACAVAALRRRRMTLNAACKAVCRALANAGISTNRNGKPISERTVLEYYERERIAARKNGQIDYENFSSWPEEASHKEFYIEHSRNRFKRRFAIEADQEADLSRSLRGQTDFDYPQGNGLSPLENLITNLKAIGPLA